MILWLESHDTRQRQSFTNFNVESFYPSISKDLVHKALQWAKQRVTIPETEEEVITTACNKVLFKDKGIWEKISSGSHDITMGSYPDAEVCELVVY